MSERSLGFELVTFPLAFIGLMAYGLADHLQPSPDPAPRIEVQAFPKPHQARLHCVGQNVLRITLPHAVKEDIEVAHCSEAYP